MIFLSLGTHEQPFERALDLVLAGRGTRALVVQHGHTAARSEVLDVEWRQYVPFEEMMELISAAEVVIAHAGVGTLMTAVRLGRRPIVLPRLAEHGEHVDDHQVHLTRRLDELGLVAAGIRTADDLAKAIDGVQHGGERLDPRPRRLALALQQIIGA